MLHPMLETLFVELVDGPATDAGWMLNPKDIGLLRSLDKLTASAASAVPRPEARASRLMSITSGTASRCEPL